WSPTSVTVKVPGKAFGATNITVRTAGGCSNPVAFLVTPYARSITPTSGRTGQIVTILGSAFGPARGNSQVLFGNVPARQFHYWSSDCVQAYVPAGFTGKVQVRVVTSGGQSAPLNFTKIGL
ncbi:MAG: IPT/TIG domain-containing protein, partial [Candidatus Geothermincolia bacterium]